MEIKNQISEQLGIGVDEQKLLLLGRTLTDDQTVESYPSIKEGTKLNLVVKKPESLYDAALKYFKQGGMTEADAVASSTRLLKVVQEKFDRMSWDDIDKLCYDAMLDESGQSQPPAEAEQEHDDMFTL